MPYCYAQFYAVFALASMYIAMLMTGWARPASPRRVMRRRVFSGRGVADWCGCLWVMGVEWR